jgi:hypothetical protein
MSGLTHILDEESEREAAEVEAALAGRGIGSSREVRERGLLEGCAYLAVEHGRYDEAFEVMLDVLGHRPRQAGPGPGRAEGPDGWLPVIPGAPAVGTAGIGAGDRIRVVG